MITGDRMIFWVCLVTLSEESTVYPKKYAHGFVVLCFVVVMQSFIMNLHEVFIHIHQGCFAGTGAIVRLPQCQWCKPDGYGKISQCITTTKHSKAKTVCIFIGIYCTLNVSDMKPNIMLKHVVNAATQRYFRISRNLEISHILSGNLDRLPNITVRYDKPCHINSYDDQNDRINNRLAIVLRKWYFTTLYNKWMFANNVHCLKLIRKQLLTPTPTWTMWCIHQINTKN